MWGYKRILILLCFGFLLFAGLVLVTGEAEGQIIVDDDNGTWADYGTIQEAIDATGSNASVGQKRIRVYEGNYYESIDIDNNIWMKGNGSDLVLIEGPGNDYAVNVISDEVTIKGFTIVGNGSGIWTHGIYDDDYDDLEIIDTVITGSTDGIRYYNADRLKLTNCYIHNNSWNGVSLFQVNRARVNDCTFENNSRFGFSIDSTTLVNFTDTTFNYDSPSLDGSLEARTTTHWFENTDVNGLPVYYLTNSSDVSVPTSVGMVILANCADIDLDGFSTENTDTAISMHQCDWINVTNGTFKGVYRGIFIQTSENCTVADSYISGGGSSNIETEWAMSTVIRNCTIRDGLRGIVLYFRSHYTLIEGCTFTKNGITSIYVYFWCEYTTIQDSHIMWGTGDGIWVRDSYMSLIHNNTINNSWSDGIYVHQNSHNTTITNNTLRQNSDNGVRMMTGIEDCTISGNDFDDNTDQGIYGAASTSRLTITNNSVYEGSAQGIYLYSSDNGTIAWNEIFNNNAYGIELSSCSDMSIHHNNIVNNGGTGSQGADSSSTNLWDDDDSEGNYWSDWNGTGTYPIDGAGSAEDRYPLGNMTDNDAPEKVPEFTLMLTVVSTIALFAVFRRRR